VAGRASCDRRRHHAGVSSPGPTAAPVTRGGRLLWGLRVGGPCRRCAKPRRLSPAGFGVGLLFGRTSRPCALRREVGLNGPVSTARRGVIYPWRCLGATVQPFFFAIAVAADVAEAIEAHLGPRCSVMLVFSASVMQPQKRSPIIGVTKMRTRRGMGSVIVMLQRVRPAPGPRRAGTAPPLGPAPGRCSLRRRRSVRRR
jgi:hypothetical protein